MYAFRYMGLSVLCFVMATGLFATPGQGAAPVALPGEVVQSAAAGAQGDPVLPARPRTFSLLDSLTVSPIPESRYAASESPGTLSFPHRGLTAGQADKHVPGDRRQSYLFSFDSQGNENHYIGLARIDRPDLMELKRTSPNEYGAELMIGYKVASLGNILFGRGLQLESPGDASIRFQDDGWRFKFVKKF